GFIPFGGTFLVFSDYARDAIRMCALMKQRVVFIYSHDSIGIGEDGPTHQPIEHISILRVTPNLKVWRPASLTETAIAWQQSIENIDGPSCLLLTRQNLEPIAHNKNHIAGIKHGAYIVSDTKQQPEVILIATGSELQIAIDSAKIAAQKGIAVRVVSMPCVEVFLAQDAEYQEYILPNSIRKRIAIEAGASAYWYKFVGLDGHVIGIDKYGKSAKAQDLYQYFNITVENTVSHILKIAEKEYDSTCCN
ncbi:MAG: transketolase, partial [Chitinophagia bacterium]|nr:transketolase [Chitinophagia bacterium]